MTSAKLSTDEIVAMKRLLDRRKLVRLNTIDVVRAGIDFARTRYLEIEQAITNQRISQLAAPPSFPEMVIYIAIGGLVDPLVAAGLERAMRFVLKDHLSFVKVALQGTAKPEVVEEWRTFFKIGANYKIKQLNIPSEQFLNPETTWGRLYRYVPQYVGSRLDEVVQLGPPKTTSPVAPSQPVAQLLLVLDLWVSSWERTVDLQYRNFDLLLDRGDGAKLKEELADAEDSDSRSDSGQSVSADRHEQAERFGNLVLLLLFAQAHPQLGTLERVENPVLLRRDGSFVHERIVKQPPSSRDVLQVAVDQLVHPRAPWPQPTFREWALQDYPRHAASLESDPHFKEDIFVRASIELIRCSSVALQEVMNSPTGNTELLRTR
ncbi:hypothetical protein [Phycicoccus avicenniae]|uniref:hypothetical protein n=1 Tax=Phycicoccus avicenniae TaxID=2828860 RepID=UPI003D2C4B97